MPAMTPATRVGLLVAAWGSVANAGNGTRKVEVESNPSGAAVYLNSVDTKPACTATPCTIDAPTGTSVVIVRKDGYEPEFGQLTVPKKGKIKPFKVSLTASFGTLAIDDPRFAGATIKIDDVDQGVAPQRVDVEPKSHRVVIVRDKQELFSGNVAVQTGATVAIEPNQSSAGSKPDRTPDRKLEPHAAAPHAATAKPSPRRNRVFAVGAVFSVNFRQFRYQNAKTTLPNEVENGQDMLGPTLELWPAALFGSARLSGLSLYGEAEFGVNQLAVIDDATGMASGAKTRWRRFEVDVRHRWPLGGGSIEANAGFASDQMSYKGDASQLPIGNYQSLRAGVRAGIRLARPLDAYAGAEGRFALDSGPLAARFGGANVFGGKAVVGAIARIGPVFVGVDGSLQYYRWSFSDTDVAGGARDLVESISLRVGAQY